MRRTALTECPGKDHGLRTVRYVPNLFRSPIAQRNAISHFRYSVQVCESDKETQ